jgi:hypothetical protein
MIAEPSEPELLFESFFDATFITAQIRISD